MQPYVHGTFASWLVRHAVELVGDATGRRKCFLHSPLPVALCHVIA